MPECIKEGAEAVGALDELLSALHSWREAIHLCKFHDRKDACNRIDPLASGYENSKEKASEKIIALSKCMLKK